MTSTGLRILVLFWLGTGGSTLNNNSLLEDGILSYPDNLLNASSVQSHNRTSEFLLDLDEGLLEDWRSLASSRTRSGESQSRCVKALLVVAYSLIIVISLFGNTLVCLVLAKSKRAQSSTGLFIMNLAVADIFMTVLSTPFTLVRFVSSNWVFARSMCHISQFVQYCSLHVSMLTLTAIALDKRQVILHPLRPHMSLTQGGCWVAVIWIMGSCFSLPHAIYQQLLTFTYSKEKERRLCVPDFPEPSEVYWQYLDLLTFALLYTLPLLIINASYATVVRDFLRHNAIGNMTAAQHATQRKRRRTLALLLLVVGVFAVCWFPLNSYVVLLSRQAIQSSNALYFCFHWLAMSSTCYKPFIYCCLNPAFRQELQLLLNMCKRRRPVVELELECHPLEAAQPCRRTAWPDNDSSRSRPVQSRTGHSSLQQSHSSTSHSHNPKETHVVFSTREVLSGRTDIMSVEPIVAVSWLQKPTL